MAVRKFEGYSLLVLEVVIIFLNALAIIVIFRFKKKYNPDILIFSLAIADLLKALIPLNMTLSAYLSEKGMAEGSSSCTIFGWTAFTLNSGIMLVMTVMAIDRYIAMCWPFKYKHYLSKRRLIYTVIAVFVFSGIDSALPLVGIGKMRSYNNGSFCHFDYDSSKPANQGYNIFVLALGISMLVVVIFCYTRAMFSVRGLIQRQRRMSTPSRDIDRADHKRQAMNRMFARLMIVMMVAFCLSWLLFLLVVLQHVSGWFQIAPEAHFWSMRLAVINSVLNPLIGAVMCKPYRKGYLFILCKCLHCCGLCSSYKTDNPWLRARKLSASSRYSSERDPNTPATNETALKVKSNPSFSCQDSGIVPDSSIGYHQGGVINAAYERDLSEAGRIQCITEDGRFKERPRLGRKRISFKDEVEGNDLACTRDQTILPQQQFADSLSSHPETSQVGSCLQERDNGNSNVMISKMNQSPSLFENQSNPGTSPRSQSLVNDRNITVKPETKAEIRQNSCQHQFSIEPIAPIRAFSIGPSFDSRRSRSNFTRTKSFESALRKKPHHKSDNSTSPASDLPVFQRHSAVLTGEQFKGVWSHSEPDLTFSLLETVLNSPHETLYTGSFRNYAAGEQCDLFTNTGFYKENGNTSQRRACDLHITSPSSRIYKKLSELSPKEVEREVFC